MMYSTVNWRYPTFDNGYKYELQFVNHITGAEDTRYYSTHRGAACAETKFHNRMSRLYGHLDMSQYKLDDARRIARVLDRLANLLDPYEYYDVVGRTEEDWDRNVETIANDLIHGASAAYIDWLNGISGDEDQSPRDRERARSVIKYIDWFERRYN